jgi:hypothetical protein
VAVAVEYTQRWDLLVQVAQVVAVLVVMELPILHLLKQVVLVQQTLEVVEAQAVLQVVQQVWVQEVETADQELLLLVTQEQFKKQLEEL